MKFQLKRRFPADPGYLFDCFTRPDLLAKWWRPFGGHCRSAEIDARIGGAYRIDYRLTDGSERSVFGIYKEVRKPERLAFTWCRPGDTVPETFVTLDFAAEGADTVVTLTHDGFVSLSEGQEKGWATLLASLDGWLKEPETARATAHERRAPDGRR